MREGTDEELMAAAATLARSARLVTPPNPWVGCVVVHDGEIVGRGGTGPYPGGAHAEVAALRDAGARAAGATAYITLEPCNHFGKTPPCTEALIAAGVARVVVALEDPDRQVRGTGIARLRDAGIDVTVGVGANALQATLAPYLHQRATGRAFALLKTAMSIDGRTAAADGSSQWITGSEARADAHRIRAESQAVVVGPGTACADRPRLTVRDHDGLIERQPLRVLLDAHGRVAAEGPLFDQHLAPTLVVTTESAPPPAVDAWQAAGAKVEVLAPGAQGRGVDLEGLLTLLARSHGVLQAMIEGGGRLHGAFVDEHLADRLVAYVAPVLLGERGHPVIGFPGPDTLADATRWRCPRRGHAGRGCPADPGPARPIGGGLMFTGIVEELGRVRALLPDEGGARIEITAATVLGDAEIGASIAVNGCCLTVVELADGWWAADAVTETLVRTSLGALSVGDPVNLERPLRLSDRLGGHLVQGHVDGVGELVDRAPLPDGSTRMRFQLPAHLTRYIVEKGSITVDGISLTVAAVHDDGFDVAVIPHTLEVTNLGSKQPGDPVNLEVDVLAKYVERLLTPGAASEYPRAPSRGPDLPAPSASHQREGTP